MAELISNGLGTANQASDYRTFRLMVYDDGHFFRRILFDSRKTTPLTLALFRLLRAMWKKTVTYAANFGSDADTIGTIDGVIVGAYQGITEIQADRVDKARSVTDVDQDELVERLILTSWTKFDLQQTAQQDYPAMWGEGLPWL